MLLLSPHITHAAGSTYYVRQDGGGDCTTIQECVNRVQGPGDTVIVHEGTYGNYGKNMSLPGVSGNSGNYITLQAAPGETVWLRGILDMWNTEAPSPPHHWTVDGINVDGGYWPNNCAGKPDDSACRAIAVAVCSDCRLQNLEVKNASYYGIALGSHIQITNVRSHGHGRDPQSLCGGNPNQAGGQCHGFYLGTGNSGDIIFDNVEAYDNYGHGIVVDYGSSPAPVIIRNSKFYENDSPFALLQPALIQVYNNLIYNNHGSGYTEEQVEFYNNTIVNNPPISRSRYTGQTTTFRNNIFYNASIDSGGAGTVIASNNLVGVNPNFISSADFHLQSSSPAINAGTTLPDVPCDADGNARPAGSAYDIGAYEYGSSPGGGCAGGGTNPTPTPTSSSAPCTQYTNASSIPPGFAVPWDVTNPSIMLVSATCTPSSTILLKAGDPNTAKTIYVYKDGYVAPSGGSGWTPVQLFGSSLISGAWYKSSAQGVTQIPDQTKATYYVAYTCQWTGSKWMCGCRDNQCAQSYWQIQKIQQ